MRSGVEDDFADRFRELCRERGVTCSTLAEAATVNRTQASRWLRGLATPSDRAAIVKIALGMTLGEFYSIKRRMTSPL
jgi:transcriptional regulator with XRE-family HTH domain